MSDKSAIEWQFRARELTDGRLALVLPKAAGKVETWVPIETLAQAESLVDTALRIERRVAMAVWSSRRRYGEPVADASGSISEGGDA